MSISDTITSIENHLSADYEGLENIGADLTGINKNILNIRTILDNIYNDMPKVTGEGTEVTLTPTRKGRLVITPKGNSTQESTTGKNLLPATLAILKATNTIGTWNNNVYTLNTLTFTINEDVSVLVNGTPNANTNFFFANNTEILPTGNYIVNGCPSGGSQTTYQINTRGGTSWTYRDIGSGVSLNNLNITGLAISVASGTQMNNMLFKPMIRLATITDGTFEQYTGGIPAPNPTYPQSIKSVTGENNVVVHNENIVGDIISNSMAGQNGVISSSTTYSRTDYIRVKENTEYYLQHFVGAAKWFTVWCYDINKNPIGAKNVSGQADVSGVITTYANTYYIIANITTEVIEENPPMIEEGNSASSYVAPASQTLPLNLGTIELNKIGDYQDYIYKTSGKNLYPITRKTFTPSVVEWYDSNYNTILTVASFNSSADKFALKKGSYYLSFNNEANIQYVQLVNIVDNAIAVIRTGAGTFTLTEDTDVLIRFRPNTANTLTDTGKIMLNIGSSALPYEPYGSGEWYKKEQIGKKVLNGTDSIDSLDTSGTNTTKVNFYSILSSKPAVNYSASKPTYSNYFIDKNIYNLDEIGIYTNANAIVFRVPKTIGTTKEEINTWLSSHNVIVNYVLATPQDIQITDTNLISQLEEIDKMQGYEGTTIITSTFDENNAQMTLSASALKGE